MRDRKSYVNRSMFKSILLNFDAPATTEQKKSMIERGISLDEAFINAGGFGKGIVNFIVYRPFSVVFIAFSIVSFYKWRFYNIQL